MPRKQIPVTVLSGFLGAGKTTMLNRILAASAGRKYAVVVNDLGEINIDASLIQCADNEEGSAIAGMLELQGGCICCSIQNDLLDALLELTQRYEPEHILIEATGVAEPKSILETLYSSNVFGRTGTDFLRVANMVTMVDAGNLEFYLESPESCGGSRRRQVLPGGRRRPLEELLMEQIECADILIINKVDELEGEANERFRGYLKSLNQIAEIWECNFGQIDVEQLMENHRFDEERTLSGAAWRNTILNNENGRLNRSSLVEGDKRCASEESHSHDHGHRHGRGGTCDHSEHGHHHDCKCKCHNCCSRNHENDEQEEHHHHKDYGLETLVFNARRPFVESQFLEVLKSGLPGVIRAKGFYWTEQVPKQVGLLSIAGKMLRADYLSDWWHTMILRGEADLDEVPDIVRKSWLPDYGDRRQELVFIGIDLDRERIEGALNSCFADGYVFAADS